MPEFIDQPLSTPAVTEAPVVSQPPFTTTATDPDDLHNLLIEQQNTNGLLVFLIALICGVVFMQNVMKGWVR